MLIKKLIHMWHTQLVINCWVYLLEIQAHINHLKIQFN